MGDQMCRGRGGSGSSLGVAVVSAMWFLPPPGILFCKVFETKCLGAHMNSKVFQTKEIRLKVFGIKGLFVAFRAWRTQS